MSGAKNAKLHQVDELKLEQEQEEKLNLQQAEITERFEHIVGSLQFQVFYFMQDQIRQMLEGTNQENDKPEGKGSSINQQLIHNLKLISKTICFLDGRTEILQKLWDLFSVLVDILLSNAPLALQKMDQKCFNRMVFSIDAYQKANDRPVSSEIAELSQMLAKEHLRRIEGSDCQVMRDQIFDPKYHEISNIIIGNLCSSLEHKATPAVMQEYCDQIKRVIQHPSSVLCYKDTYSDNQALYSFVNQLVRVEKKLQKVGRVGAQQRQEVLDAGFMEFLYYNVLLAGSMSLFFFKVDDPLFILEIYSDQISNKAEDQNAGKDKDFWIKVEDLLMRKKNDYGIEDVARIVKMYAGIGAGTAVFWREVEELLLVRSAQFRVARDAENARQMSDNLVNVVEAFSQTQRHSQTFWNVFTKIIVQSFRDSVMGFDQEIAVLSAYRSINPAKSVEHIFKSYQSEVFQQMKESRFKQAIDQREISELSQKQLTALHDTLKEFNVIPKRLYGNKGEAEGIRKRLNGTAGKVQDELANRGLKS